MKMMLVLMLPNLRQWRVLSIMDPFPPFHHPHKWLLWSFYNKEIRRAQPSRVSNGEDTGNQKESQMFWTNPNILQKGRRIKTFCQKFNHIYVETLNLRRKQVGTRQGSRRIGPRTVGPRTVGPRTVGPRTVGPWGRNPPTDIYPPIVGRIYPIPVYDINWHVFTKNIKIKKIRYGTLRPNGEHSPFDV